MRVSNLVIVAGKRMVKHLSMVPGKFWGTAKSAGIFAILSATFVLNDCGGGSGGTTSAPPPPPPPPPVELFVGAHLIPQIGSTGSDDTSVYVASQFEIIQIDKVTGARRPVIGAVIDPSIGGGNEGNFSFPQGLTRDGDYLYFSNSDGRLQRVFLGADGKSSLQTIVPQIALPCCQLNSVAGNDTDAFWVAGAGPGIVYRKSYANDNPPTPLATIAGDARIIVTSSQVYATSIDPLVSPSVSRIDVATGAVLPLQDLIPSTARNTHTAISAGYFYWVNGSTLYRVPHGGSTPEVVITKFGIANIAADDASVYAIDGSVLPNVLNRIDTVAKTISPVAPLPVPPTDLLLHQGTLYWSGFDGALYTINSDGTTPMLSPNAGGFGLVVVGGKIVSSTGGDGIAFYDIASGTTTKIRVTTPGPSVFADSTSAYYGSVNAGIVRLPADVNYRVPQNLPTPNGVFKFLVNSGWIYMSEFTTFFSSEQRISRMHLDGSGYEPLFTGEHRGLEILDGNLYFMCQSACSLADWTLVSMAPTGGTPDPLGDVGLDPQQMILRNRIFYVDTSLDGVTLDVFSVNLDLSDAAHLLGPFSLEATSTLDASARWLYRGEFEDLARYRIKSWNQVEPRQVVDTGNPFDLTVITGSSVHTDGKNVYYWQHNVGLKRVSEDK
jgi:hypothetical protein